MVERRLEGRSQRARGGLQGERSEDALVGARLEGRSQLARDGAESEGEME